MTEKVKAEGLKSIEWVKGALLFAREEGRRHAALGLVSESYVPAVADVALEDGWHVVAIWPSGNRTMVLFRLVPP